MGYEELVSEVRKFVRASIESRFRGEMHAHKVRAQAYADGYMRALSDAGLIGQEELLQLVGEVRLAAESEPASEPRRMAAAG